MYPLFVDTSDKSEEEAQSFDSNNGAIVCIEGGKRDANALNIVKSKIGDSYYIPEMEIANYISDTNITKASVRKNTNILKVRYFNSEHTCPLRDRVLSKVQASVGFIGGVAAPKLVNHKRKHTPNDIIDDIREMYGVEISCQQAWRAKERALELIRGNPADAYRHMPR
ncbi:hypothetical protein H5410_014691 [Solanum commersonii]|uniref:Uncharacterized protein n=1 Tax=Solanum commersonii TaxID=4109 RepID=A0A9J5ZRY7_SOLCO|nr:hypothetical protein H5410_014691 [Solanum commersonii]